MLENSSHRTYSIKSPSRKRRKVTSEQQSPVKKEKHNDKETNELAKKIIKTNKGKMALTLPNKSNQQVSSNGLLNVLNLVSINKSGAATATATTSSTASISNNDTSIRNLLNVNEIDEESIKGRFGWTTMGGCIHIPYIIRSGENYCSVRMVEMKCLNKWLNYLHQDIYNCTNIRSFYVTLAEAQLFNEINLIHCESQFGYESFTRKDLIVKLTDAEKFYEFLGYCYAKLICNINVKNNDGINRCGFIRINRESVVPYTIIDNEKYVPLFYFEGETDNLSRRANKLEGWDLAYLKFCCKIQGIRNDLFSHDSCSVISINDIKNYFPPGTIFEDYWPNNSTDITTQQLLLTDNRLTNFNTKSNGVQWTRQPLVSPQSSSSSSSSSCETLSNYYNSIQSINTNNKVIVDVLNGTPIISNNNNNNNNNIQRHQTYGKANGTITTVAAQQSKNRILNSAIATPNPYIVPLEQSVRALRPRDYAGADIIAPLHPPPPPPLLRSASNNFGIYYPANPIIRSPSLPQRTSTNVRTTNSTTNSSNSNKNSSGTSGTSSRSNSHKTKPLNLTSPYRLQRITIHDKILDAINMKPNVFNDTLVLLQDLIKHFFQGVSIEDCKKVLKALAVDVYNANSGQMQVLLDYRICTNKNEAVPLVHVKSILNFMPQLKYMLYVSSSVDNHSHQT